MATLTVTESTRVNRPVAISGEAFEADATVVVSVDQLPVQVSILADENGDFDAEGIFAWAPSKEGVYVITADDGTNRESASVSVYSTT